MSKKPLVCRIELNKANDKKGGIIVTVENEADKTTQTIHMDGETITIKVKGKKTSVMTMTHDTVHIKTTKFILDAEESIKCTSKKGPTTIQAKSGKGKMTLKADADMAISSTKKNVKVSAKQNLDQQAMNAKIKAKTNLQMEATNIKAKAKAQAALDAAMVKAKAKSQASLEGAMANIKASGICNVQGQVTNLKGSVANIQGSITKIG